MAGALVLVFALLSISACHSERQGFTVVEDSESIEIATSHYALVIEKEGFRYRFERPNGSVIAAAHPVSGLVLAESGSDSLHAAVGTRLVHQTADRVELHVTAGENLGANVSVYPAAQFVRFEVVPAGTAGDTFIIDARTASLAPAYGLGDHGGWQRNANITQFVDENFHNIDNRHRFVSTFSVFPAQGFAQVLFDRGKKRVAITDSELRLGAEGVRSVDGLYYFVGSMEEIYRNYKKARIQEGYPDRKPKYAFFEVGYEAFGSLGWNTYQRSVESDIRQYLERGYHLRWVVVGSGFWKGSRKEPDQGATTSFGIWDDAFEEGRDDGLPNPRYPDPDAFKEFFEERNIELLIGLRINFKAPPDKGGHHVPLHDGPYTLEGISRSFFREGPDGKPLPFIVNFPKDTVFFLDGDKREAVDWFVEGAKRWGAAGFKEDTMLNDGDQLYDDAKLNRVNEALMDEGYLVMVRNAAYSVPGDILRLEDTMFSFDQDRPVINALSYAASGAPAVYPDIVAGKYLELPLTEDQKRYFVRNAMFAAVTPVMSMGLGPWHLENEAQEQIVRKAADWHNEFAPYIYSAVIEAYETGYPHAMTPLPIAFPDDPKTYDLANDSTRQYEWMLGPSMLVTPAYGDDYASVTARDIYVPAGKWIDPETGAVIQGPVLLEQHPLPPDKIPVLIGGKGVVVTRDLENDSLYATVYPVVSNGSAYHFTAPDGESKSRIVNDNAGWDPATLKITDTTVNRNVPFSYEKTTGAFRFLLDPGHDYRLEGGAPD